MTSSPGQDAGGGEQQKIAVPIAEDDSYRSEGAWATQVGGDRYRIDNVLAFVDGVSHDDVVRVDVAPDGTLYAVEVVERAPATTIVVTPGELGEQVGADVRAAVHAACPDEARVASEGLFRGLVAYWFHREAEDRFWDALLDAVHDVTGEDPVPVGDDGRLGPLGWWVVTHHDWDVPQPIDATRYLEGAVAPELVAVDWPRPDDEVAASLPALLVEDWRERATDDERLRRMLDHRLYLQAATLDLRFSLEGFGPAAMGPQPWPLGAPGDDDARARWLAARDGDGRVRYCVDDDADEAMRAAIASLGLDPDADPYEPST